MKHYRQGTFLTRKLYIVKDYLHDESFTYKVYQEF